MLSLGVDLGGTKTEIVALDQGGAELLRRRMTSPVGDYHATLENIVHLVQTAEADLGETGMVGIGTPGACSAITGRLKNSNSVWLNGRPLKSDLEQALQREVRLANDANCFALSEAVDGAGAGARLVFGVILGTGTGGGIAVDGKVWTGPNAIAGEWGHNPLPWARRDEIPGHACYCGRSGCIETFVSGPGMAADHRKVTGERESSETIARRAGEGDPGCLRTLERYADRLARGLAHVINLLDPDVIVLGGGLSKIQELYTEVPRLWADYVFSDRVTTPLLPPRHGDSSGVRGAAWLWKG